MQGEMTSPFQKLYNNVPITVPSGNSSLPYFVPNVDKEWLPDIYKALFLCSGGTRDR